MSDSETLEERVEAFEKKVNTLLVYHVERRREHIGGRERRRPRRGTSTGRPGR